MRPIVSIITALAVNLHLVLGCCAHHAHEHAHADGDVACLDAHPCSHGHNHATAPTNPARPTLPTHGDCHDSHCAFLIANALNFSPDLAVAFLGVPAHPTARELA